jgi:hypothetical protein
LQKYKSSGALKQNGQPSAVDLRSNGHGRARAPWTAPCARRTGPRWTAPFKRRGTRSGPSVQDLMALDVCTRWAAVASLETGAARRCLALIRRRTLSCCSGRHLARVWALRVAGEHASKPRGSGGWRGHPRRPAPEGGGPASPASPRGGLNVQGREIRAGKTLLTTS